MDGVNRLLLHDDRLLLHVNRLLNVRGLSNSFVNHQSANGRWNAPAPTATVPTNPLALGVSIPISMTMVLSHGRDAKGHEDEGN